MNRLRYAIAAAVCMLASPASTADDWREIAKTRRTVLYVDIDSVRPTEQTAAFWSIIDYLQPRMLPNTGKKIVSAKLLREARCDVKSLATLHTIYYEEPGAKGKPIGEFVQPGQAIHFVPAAAGSDEDRFLEVVCVVAETKRKR